MARRSLLLASVPLLCFLALSLRGAPEGPSPLSTSPLPGSPLPTKLVIVGGGGTPPAALQRGLELAGKKDVDVVVLPFASEREDRGEGSCEMWLEAGARSAVNLDHAEPKEAAKAIREADLVWMPGGSQSRLMEALEERGLVEAIREVAHNGDAVVGGTSAGAAVMSTVMIRRSAEEDALIQGRTPVGEGLGLFKLGIVDQHFVRRGRNVRLLQTVLENPAYLGFGIDERTALVVNNTEQFEVVGEGQVLVYDAMNATIETRESDGRYGARGLRMHILLDGDTWTPRQGDAR